MNARPANDARDGWTAKSVGIAVIATMCLMALFQQLEEIGLLGDSGWTPLVGPALAGALVLGWRHQGTWLLSLLLYFPSMLFVLYWMAFLVAVSRGDVP